MKNSKVIINRTNSVILKQKINVIIDLFSEHNSVKSEDMIITNKATIYDVTPIYLKKDDILKTLQTYFGSDFNFQLHKSLIDMIIYIDLFVGWPESTKH